MNRKRLAVMLVMAAGVSILVFAARAPRLTSNSVLLMKIGGDIPEAPRGWSPILSLIERPAPTMLDKIMTLRKAKVDPRIDAVVIKITPCDFGMAKAQELRDAILDYRESGKPAIAYFEAGGDAEYYIACACDKVYMAESSYLDLNGISSRALFLGGLWEKIYIDVYVDKIEEYKSAGDMIAARDMSPAVREMLNSILDSGYDQLLSGIAEARGLERSKVEEIVDELYMFPEKYVEAGLLDGIKYFDEVIGEAKAGREKKPVVKEHEYARVEPSRLGINKGPKVAVVYGIGSIVTGNPGGSPFRGEVMASDPMVKELMKAADDDEIEAVIFRIDSGGGSALASDLIWRATQKIREKKPFVVSMSDVAGSGGYYVACGADRIVAQPGTITGSIGVVSGHFSFGRLFKKIGLNRVTLKRGRFGDIGNMSRTMTSEEKAKMRSGIEDIYDMFTGKVSQGRGMSKEKVNEIGRGRVWTGAQAGEHGLVDETGGIMAAVEIVKDRLGVPEDKDVELVYKKPPMTLWQFVMGRGGEEMMRALLTEDERELIELSRSMRLYRDGEPLFLMPFVTLE